MAHVIDANQELKNNIGEDGSSIDSGGLSHHAIVKLRSSGISPKAAITAGIYSVENAKEEVHEEFASVPALVIPYFNQRGESIFFERDGELLQFIRVRYLADPPAADFIRRKWPKYMQLKGSGVHAYFPKVPGFDWAAISDHPEANIVITEGELKALGATLAGVATIAIGGVDCFLHNPERDT